MLESLLARLTCYHVPVWDSSPLWLAARMLPASALRYVRPLSADLPASLIVQSHICMDSYSNTSFVACLHTLIAALPSMSFYDSCSSITDLDQIIRYDNTSNVSLFE